MPTQSIPEVQLYKVDKGELVTLRVVEGVGVEEEVVEREGVFVGVGVLVAVEDLEVVGVTDLVEDGVGVAEIVFVREGVLVGVEALEDVRVTVLVKDEVIEGVIDGVGEKPPHTSPVPQTEKGLPHSTEPP